MSLLNNKVFKNASWIIGCKIAQAILGLVVSMLTARYLGPANFGVLNYAASIVAFVAPIMNLGISSVLVQEFVAKKDNDGVILGTATTLCFISSFFCIAGVFAFTFIANGDEPETIIVCVLYSILLIFQALELVQYWFQAKYLSKYVSIIMFIAYFVVSAYKIILLVYDKGIYWFSVSQAFDFFLIAVGMLVVYKKLGGDKFSFSLSTAKRLLKNGKYYILSNMMITIFANTDKIMIKLMIDDTAAGLYSAGVACAGITGFVFSAIIDSFRPLIFECKGTKNENYEKNVSRLYCIVTYLSLLQSLFMTIFASIIVKILYGEEYSEASDVLRVIVWYTTFSYFGSVRNIWMLAENKQKYLWVINLSGALLNVILNFALIPIIGIIGAALASLVTQFFTNVIIGYIIIPIRQNNRLMLRGFDLRLLFSKRKNANKLNDNSAKTEEENERTDD